MVQMQGSMEVDFGIEKTRLRMIERIFDNSMKVDFWLCYSRNPELGSHSGETKLLSLFTFIAMIGIGSTFLAQSSLRSTFLACDLRSVRFCCFFFASAPLSLLMISLRFSFLFISLHLELISISLPFSFIFIFISLQL
jgi:hypothetical protein